MANERPDQTTILKIENVAKTYQSSHYLFGRADKGVTAVNDVSINVKKGEVFGLVGGSGSGKTTLARLVLKLERFDSGRIHFEDMDVATLKGPALKAFRRRIQMIPQDPYQSLNPYFSIYETIAEPLVIHGIGDDKTRKQLVENALTVSGLLPASDYFARYPHQLSGGQRQRAAIARAMVLDPHFIIADEPTSMLDASISIAIFRLLYKIKRQKNVTFLFITHDLAAARFFCDRIAVIHHGRIVETGPTCDIIDNPQTAYTQALIAAQPRFVYLKKTGKRSC
ncbi:MAG: ABC transporter ATP-binding protein [Desulfatitalea sp.]|nr:ABC transporter ATP-binding protein [Desulfatitalea sp.]